MMLFAPSISQPLYFSAILFSALAIFCSSAIAKDLASATTDSAPRDVIQTWIAENAIAVRSIDPLDEDFSDLNPLINAIGSARVVQLGEPSHGAGSGFAAKVRLIKFLHQRMGFDVLAWESGLYEVRLVQAAMRGGENPVAAAQRGILPIWSNAEQVKPLLEYWKVSQASVRPLEMVGIDMQVRFPGNDERFSADLRSFVRALNDSALKRSASDLVDQFIAAYKRLSAHSDARRLKHMEISKAGQAGSALEATMKAWETQEGSKLRPTKEDQKRFDSIAEDLLVTIRTHRAAFEQAHGEREATFMECAIVNMRGQGTGLYDRERPDAPTGPTADALQWNRRDELMADNLRWLIEKVYPGKKIIVWAHNAHLMNAYFASDWRSVHKEPQPGGMKPTGAFLAEWLKEDVYTIALTTYEGEEAWVNGQRRGPIAPAPDGSLESRLHRLGKPFVFLDFRTLESRPDHPMRAPQSMRVSGYGVPTGRYGNDVVPDLTEAFDAVLYIDRMAPASPISGGK